MPSANHQHVNYTRLKEDKDLATVQIKDNGNPNRGNFSSAIEAAGFGKFHVILLLVCGWANMSDAVEILSVSYLLPNASRDMEISSPQKGLLTSIIFIGMLVGGYFWGSLADIQGRRQILIYSLACNATFGLLSSISYNFWLFLTMRFLSGVGVGGSIPVIFCYFSEFQPSRHRGAMVSCLATFWMAGNIVTAALAWAVIPRDSLLASLESWRVFVALCCIPAASSVLAFLLMPESPKYLLERGEESKALNVIKDMYMQNKGVSNADSYPIRYLIASSKEEKQMLRNDVKRGGYCDQTSSLFRATCDLFQGPLARPLISMLVIIFSLSFGYYGLWMWLPELFKRVEMGGSACSDLKKLVTAPSINAEDNIYKDGFYTALSNLPGNLVSIFLMDRLGRKFLLTSSLLVSGLCVFFIWFLETRAQVLAMSIIFGAISVISWNSLSVLSVELYPTVYRSTALGVQGILNRTGAILGSLMFGILIDLHCAVPMILIAFMLALGGFTAFTLPNTTKIELK
ncbi:synaptic vesicle glycoprotein 2B-like [Lytechinus pictus]|uniref:synaptic vesicle glycoprotein 2B-like n=1 Tax=Lytechinus pictus TaxID=7653 RepID=UPI0030BA1E73